MILSPRTKTRLLSATDAAFALWPRQTSPPERIKAARVIAHRGAWGPDIRENTMSGFRRALELGAWAIEFDIRWTGDGLPLVHHDETALRVFEKDLRIGEMRFDVLRREIPEAPLLDEVIETFGGQIHFFVEIKGTRAQLTSDRIRSLRERLLRLQPVVDFHVMAIDPHVLLALDFLPREALVPIAEFNSHLLTTLALKERFAGLTGPYALVRAAQIRRHRDVGQTVGTGFISSPSVCWRELSRGVDWLFTNQAALLLKWLS